MTFLKERLAAFGFNYFDIGYQSGLMVSKTGIEIKDEWNAELREKNEFQVLTQTGLCLNLDF